MSPASKIDDAIFGYFAAVGGRWQKVAMVIAHVAPTLRDDIPPGETGFELIAKRIASLVGDGRLQAVGNVAIWRNSEIKPASPPN